MTQQAARHEIAPGWWLVVDGPPGPALLTQLEAIGSEVVESVRSAIATYRGEKPDA